MADVVIVVMRGRGALDLVAHAISGLAGDSLPGTIDGPTEWSDLVHEQGSSQSAECAGATPAATGDLTPSVSDASPRSKDGDGHDGDIGLVHAGGRLAVVAAMLGALTSAAVLLGWGVRITLVECRISEERLAALLAGQPGLRAADAEMSRGTYLAPIDLLHDAHASADAEAAGSLIAPDWEEIKAIAVAVNPALSATDSTGSDVVAETRPGMVGGATSAKPSASARITAAVREAIAELHRVEDDLQPRLRAVDAEIERIEAQRIAAAALAAAEHGQREQHRAAVLLEAAEQRKRSLHLGHEQSGRFNREAKRKTASDSGLNAHQLSQDFGRQFAETRSASGIQQAREIEVTAALASASAEDRLAELEAASVRFKAERERLQSARSTAHGVIRRAYEHATASVEHDQTAGAGSWDRTDKPEASVAKRHALSHQQTGPASMSPADSCADLVAIATAKIDRLLQTRRFTLLRPDLALAPPKVYRPVGSGQSSEDASQFAAELTGAEGVAPLTTVSVPNRPW